MKVSSGKDSHRVVAMKRAKKCIRVDYSDVLQRELFCESAQRETG